MDHYNSSSSSLKTTTDNSTSRFNFRNENYTARHTVFLIPESIVKVLAYSSYGLDLFGISGLAGVTHGN